MILLKNCDTYGPEYLGRKDVLIAGTKVVAIGKNLKIPKAFVSDTINGEGLRLMPGLIDGHVHFAGAGGEGGPSSRTPEVQLSQMTTAGVTTAVGCLGTDGYTRTIEGLLMKAKGLRQEGFPAWIYSGSYQVPPPNITGDVATDLCYIDEIIGVGEIAIADHRSSSPTVIELIKLAKRVKVGGLLGGKAGIVHLHMGDAPDPFRIIHEAVRQSELSYKNFYPTHINRNTHIFEEAKSYGKLGPIDFTASSYPFFPDEEIKPSKGVRELLDAGVPSENITISSDAGGSLPAFDADGKLERVEIGRCVSLLHELRDLICEEKFSFSDGIRFFTSNVAKILNLPNKGRIAVGSDADLVLLDQDFLVRHVLISGNFHIRDGKVHKHGLFETSSVPESLSRFVVVPTIRKD